MPLKMSGLLPLKGALQSYAWGLSGRESLAAALHAANTGVAVDPAKPAAELWIGTHPSGPATLHSSGVTLRETLGHDVPFLLKVLSVARPLSIQAHPDKQRAEKLHALRPDKYKDDNHKPEMAVALTPFEGMCSFRPLGEIKETLARLTPLCNLVGGDTTLAALETGTDGLRTLFSTLMQAPTIAVLEALTSVESIVQPTGSEQPADADELFLRLRKYYPEDVGCFAAYLLNHVRIMPGEAFFMAANEPHAYLSGQCVEIMACSDNVVRAGLTPKFKDVDALIEMLTYKPGMPEIMRGEKEDKGGTLYRAAAKEFQVMKYALGMGERAMLEEHQGPGLLLVVEGSGDVEYQGEHTIAKKGFAAYLPDATAAQLTAGAEGIVLFRASVNQKA